MCDPSIYTVLFTGSPKRRKMVVLRQKKIQPQRANDAWSMNFVSNQLGGGAKFRALTIVDVYTKEALAINVCVQALWCRY